MPILSVDNLVKSYGQQRALDGVSLNVQPGECYGLLGPNGAGKTTLISIISCILAADSGTAQLLGQPLIPSNKAIRPAIGIAPQEIAVYGALTARENLMFFGRLYELPEARLKERVERLLDAVGLLAKADVRAETFSGGMQRRLNLAAALVHEPKLLLLDEPTAGVDPQSRNHLFEEIRRCTREGMTILYTTHYMEEVETLCSKVAIMDHGKIVADDKLENLLSLMPSQVRLQFEQPVPQLLSRLEKQPEVTVEVTQEGRQITVQSRVNSTLLAQTVRWLGDCQVQPQQIEAVSPNLERVFLHLTGRGLRD
jgi:ABC-2 type transport system ATP-binding protein